MEMYLHIVRFDAGKMMFGRNDRRYFYTFERNEHLGYITTIHNCVNANHDAYCRENSNKKNEIK